MNERGKPVLITALEVQGGGSGASPLAVRMLSVSERRGPVLRLELQRSDEDDRALSSPMVVDISVSELQASIGAIVDAAEAVYRFEDCNLSTGTRLLTRDGHEIHLRPKVYQMLIYLLEHRDRAVSRDELCDVVWDGRMVGNATVDSTVKALRNALGDNGIAQRVVRTISGYGYRFAAKVESTVRDSGLLRQPALISSEHSQDGFNPYPGRFIQSDISMTA